jgi:hypothetical protein
MKEMKKRKSQRRYLSGMRRIDTIRRQERKTHRKGGNKKEKKKTNN